MSRAGESNGGKMGITVRKNNKKEINKKDFIENDNGLLYSTTLI